MDWGRGARSWLWGVALVAAGAASVRGASPEGAPPEIRFVTPHTLAMLVGATPIEVEVAGAGSGVARIEIRVDGKPLATLTAPPWKTSFDAGLGAQGHRLEATLHTADGRTASASVRTIPLRIDQIEAVDLVNLYAIVLDRAGNYVNDLGQQDFRILENGRQQRLERFSAERKPLRVAIVLDISNSMAEGKGAKLQNAKEAALEFLDVLAPGDEGMIVTFNDEVRVAQDLTRDASLLAAAIRDAESGGGTALYDAVWRSARHLRDFDGRRVMVLLSDGSDESYSGLEPGSLHTLEEALSQAIHSEVMIFSIGLGHDLDRQYEILFGPLGGMSNQNVKRSLESILRQLAESTGGRALISASAGRLRGSFEEVAADLRNQYSLAYSSDDAERNGKWRELQVSVPGRRDLTVVTRKGYYAPGATDVSAAGPLDAR